MSTGTIVFIVVVVILIGLCIGLYIFGKRAQKKQAEQQEQLDAAAQTMSMLIIDKKKMKLKDAGLPAAVLAQTPKLMRGSKVPIVKAKVGPKVMTMLCDANVFEIIPVKKEVKATVSGLYITGVKGLHGAITQTAPVKKSFRAKLQQKYNEASAQLKNEEAASKSKKKK